MSATVDAPFVSVFGRSNHAASLVIPRQTLVRRRYRGQFASLGNDAPKEAERTEGWLPERPITPLKEPGKADKP